MDRADNTVLFFLLPNMVNATEKPYAFKNALCIGKSCWNPDTRVTETHKTGDILTSKLKTKQRRVRVCGRKFDSGCPEDVKYNKRLAEDRLREGWRIVLI